jgi:hypothetical protein
MLFICCQYTQSFSYEICHGLLNRCVHPELRTDAHGISPVAISSWTAIECVSTDRRGPGFDHVVAELHAAFDGVFSLSPLR